MSAPVTEKPIAELPLVEVSVESTFADPIAVPIAEGYSQTKPGKLTVRVPLAPKPDRVQDGFGVDGKSLALTYSDAAAVQAIDAAAEAAGSAYFSVPGIPIAVVEITGKKGTVYTAIDASRKIGNETVERQQIADRRAYLAQRIAAENAEAERKAKDTARTERLAAVEEAFAALHRDEQLGFLASKVNHLQGTERFKVTNPAAVGLS